MAMSQPSDPAYWHPRQCLRDPIPEIFFAARQLGEAAEAYLDQNFERARRIIIETDLPVIREWIESLWGSVRDNPDQKHYLRQRPLVPEPKKLPPDQREKLRMPSAARKAEVYSRDGWHCRYCGIPLIHTEARKVLQRKFPVELRWGSSNLSRHSAFQAMTPEFEHVVPHCYGGTNNPENAVTACGPCNCGKYDRLLDQHGLLDPRLRAPKVSSWDGLIRLI